MLRDPELAMMAKAYARWAPVYDMVCGPVFLNGRRAASRALRRRKDPGDRCRHGVVIRRLRRDDRDHRHRHFGADDPART